MNLTNIEVGQWCVYEDGLRTHLVQVSNVGFVAEIAFVRTFADGSEEFEFHPASQNNLIPVDPEQVQWENGRPLLPKSELDRRQKAADEAAARDAHHLELARKPGTKFEVVMGASGRWVARRVISDLGNGKYTVAPPAFTGHVPVRKLDKRTKPSSIVERQLRRKVAAGETSPWNNGPRGGSSFIITL